MIRTKDIVLDPNDIDPAWCFEYLLGLDRPLNGADLKIRSVFSEDRTPSFSIYKTSGGVYRYNCLSTGQKGSHIDLYVALQKQKGNTVSYHQAKTLLKREFEAFRLTGQYQPQETQVITNGKGKVTDIELRKWDADDKIFWEGRYTITQEIREHFNVAAGKRFVMEKLKDGKMEQYVFEHPRIYVFYRKDGTVDRVYRPGSKKGKFIKVGGPYVQGSDQVVIPKENLIYIKSLKDIMGFHTLDIDNYDLKAPDAEGIMIPKVQIEKDKKTYKKIFSWMDPDQAGVKATLKYQLEGIPPLGFDMGPKDLTDTLEVFNKQIIRLKLLQLL